MGTTTSRKRGRKPVLLQEEEYELVEYMKTMSEYGHGLNVSQLKNQVAFITQERETPFIEGIPGADWLRWFRSRHPDLALRTPQGLDQNREKALNEVNVKTFYKNLQELYSSRSYQASHIWNVDKSGAQAGRNGGGRVFVRTSSRVVHRIISNKREWLSVLTCINANGGSIPNLYIFKGQRVIDDYTGRCKKDAVMAMQEKAWMTGYIFFKWLDHFAVHTGVTPENRHLLILDGHGSHVTLDVILKAQEIGLYLLTLLSHTRHALQPLDVSVFKPFKTTFRVYRDLWTQKHHGSQVSKQILLEWVSKALKKALTEKNIKAGFQATGIMSFNNKAMEGKTTPSAISCFLWGTWIRYTYRLQRSM